MVEMKQMERRKSKMKSKPEVDKVDKENKITNTLGEER